MQKSFFLLIALVGLSVATASRRFPFSPMIPRTTTVLIVEADAEEPKNLKKRATYIDLFKDEGPAPAPEEEEGETKEEKRATYIDLFKDEGPAPAPEEEGEMKEKKRATYIDLFRDEGPAPAPEEEAESKK